MSKVTIDILLPAISSERSTEILKVTYSYSTFGELFVAPPSTMFVWRTNNSMAMPTSLFHDFSYSHTLERDVLTKLLLIGDSGVGKSKFLLQFTDGSFTTSYITTTGIDLKAKTVDLDGKRIKLQIWDTGSQEFFRRLFSVYYRGAMGVLFVYDVTNVSSFNNVRVWYEKIQEHTPHMNKILVGNKSDMSESKRAVPTSRGQALADEYGIKFIETSAKTNLNVDQVFFSLLRDMMSRFPPPETDSIPVAPTIQVETSQRRHRNSLAYARELLSKKK